jgi:hypothetical protein
MRNTDKRKLISRFMMILVACSLVETLVMPS